MKIRDLIIVVLVIGMLVSTGTLVAFASTGIGDIKDSTSQASSGELVEIATDKLYSTAGSIRNSLDRQMGSQYETVKTWAKDPSFLNAAKKAQDYSLEELINCWSNFSTRSTVSGEVPGDGDPDNDIDPAVSRYLAQIVHDTNFLEIFITDARGFVIAASGTTSDFDQGPEDWRLLYTGIKYEIKQMYPVPGGESWYKACNESNYGFYVSDVTWDDSTLAWAIEIVSQLRDPQTDEYLGVIKASFDYGTFIQDLVYVEALDFYEIKVTDQEGRILATSMEDKTKVNNVFFKLNKYPYFAAAMEGPDAWLEGPAADENEKSVYAGAAVSLDVNEHVILVSMLGSDLEQPIDAFVGQLQSTITDRSSSLNTTMLLVGIAVALAIIAAAVVIIRAKVSIPLRKLTAVSNKLSQGEIEGLTIDIEGKDEISSFGESFKGVLAAFHFLKDEAEKKQ